MDPLFVYIDGQCGLCRREAALWRWLDRGRGRIRLIDISLPDFDAGPTGRSLDQLMREIHARCGEEPGSPMLTGPEVFRRAYAAVGLGWILAPTRWPGLRRATDWAYARFAAWRYKHACASDGACRVGPAAGTSAGA